MGFVLLIVSGLAVLAYFTSRARAMRVTDGKLSSLHSRPAYHGLYSFLLTAIAGLATALLIHFVAGWYMEKSLYQALPEEIRSRSALVQERLVIDARNMAMGNIVGKADDAGVDKARRELAVVYKSLSFAKSWSLFILATLASLIGFGVSYRRIVPAFRSRNRAERILRFMLMACAGVAIIVTFGILFSLIGETVKFFRDVSIFKFLFGTHWSPLSGVYEGKLDENTVGVIPLFAGTALITLIAMVVAVPVGLFSAIYLSEFASPVVRATAKPMLEILAGIPTVVYGFFAALTVAPFIRSIGESIGLAVSAQSALAAGLVMGIMIIPFISSLSDDVINAVPQSLRDGSYGLGATRAETVIRVVLPAALPGIVSAIILAISRAVGETMIVVMAAGQGANLTWNPLEAVTTVTVQIVALINGDTDASTAAGPAFSLGFTLFFITMAMNLVALRVVQKYRQKYD
jgi:phosphate transport system permease protein